ncbi:ABC-2 type transport system permease protein [Nonomuraea solani]|uniref:Transport permease protein n=1 Tax=Nonomuraea solani TaxID=1144553 RepID=A0A1H6D2B5_9ACTN|nr:ABC transporter permease [Nonomuraea solani]SEG78786.1 ABC-2 type transport system permease protein [Nonomuraea solani]
MKLFLVETKLHLREWPFLLFTLGLPTLLLIALGYGIPGMTEVQASGERVVDTHMPSMMTLLTLLMLACNVVPAVLTTYREQGVLRRMSTTPVHPGRVLGAQLVINLAIGAVSTVLLTVAGMVVFGSSAPKQWAGFVLVFLLGTAALLAIGLVIAALAPNGKVAPGIGSAVMFPLMYVAGMWTPRETMPDGLRLVSDFSVAGPFAQALRDTWAGHAPQLMHLAVVAAGLVVFGGLAVRLFRWE